MGRSIERYYLVFDQKQRHYFVETIEDFRRRDGLFSTVEAGPFSRLHKKAERLNIQNEKRKAKLPDCWL